MQGWIQALWWCLNEHLLWPWHGHRSRFTVAFMGGVFLVAASWNSVWSNPCLHRRAGFIYTAAFYSVRLLSVHMFLQKWSVFRAFALWSVASCNAGHCCTCFYSYSGEGVCPCQKALEEKTLELSQLLRKASAFLSYLRPVNHLVIVTEISLQFFDFKNVNIVFAVVLSTMIHFKVQSDLDITSLDLTKFAM